MPYNQRTKTVKQFSGLNTADSDYEVGVDALVVADNVDITRRQKLVRRKGFSQVVDNDFVALGGGGDVLLAATATNVYMVDASYTLTSIATGSYPSVRTIASFTANGHTYWSCGNDLGVIYQDSNSSFVQPDITEIALTDTDVGPMTDGNYQYALVYVFEDGSESPPSTVGFIEASSSQGYTLTDSTTIPSDVSVRHRDLYITTPNGRELYYQGSYTTSSFEFYVNENYYDLSRPLKFLVAISPTAFTQATEFRGRMYLSKDQFVQVSHPYAYNVYDPMAFLAFDTSVRVMGAVEGGIWFGTDNSVQFYDGVNMDQKAAYGAFANTLTYVPGHLVGEGDTQDTVAVWMSPKGFCMGFPDGEFRNVSERKIDLSSIPADNTYGSSIFRTLNGQHHVVSTLRY